MRKRRGETNWAKSNVSDVRIPLLNREEEMGNQSKCDEIDECLEELGTFVCDNLCCHRQEDLLQEELDWFCHRCKLQYFTDKVREECMK